MQSVFKTTRYAIPEGRFQNKKFSVRSVEAKVRMVQRLG